MALHFCGSLILRIGVFLCFAGTNFCDWERLVFLAGKYFLSFSGSRFQIDLITFSFFIGAHAKERKMKQHANVKQINQCHS